MTFFFFFDCLYPQNLALDPIDNNCALLLLLLKIMMQIMMTQDTTIKVRVSNLHGSQDQDHGKLSPKGFSCYRGRMKGGCFSVKVLFSSSQFS